MNRGSRIVLKLAVADAVIRPTATVLHTQIEYVTLPPGEVRERCCTSWAVRQIAPAWCERVGDGDGLGEFEGEREGDGLGDPEGEGLGLVLTEGLGLLDELVLGLPDGLLDGLVLGLGELDGLALADGELARMYAIRLADVTATEPLPHGELRGRTADASAGATAKPDASRYPAAMQTAYRPARMIPGGAAVLRSSSRLSPAQPSRLRRAIDPSIGGYAQSLKCPKSFLPRSGP